MQHRLTMLSLEQQRLGLGCNNILDRLYFKFAYGMAYPSFAAYRTVTIDSLQRATLEGCQRGELIPQYHKYSKHTRLVSDCVEFLGTYKRSNDVAEAIIHPSQHPILHDCTSPYATTSAPHISPELATKTLTGGLFQRVGEVATTAVLTIAHRSHEDTRTALGRYQHMFEVCSGIRRSMRKSED